MEKLIQQTELTIVFTREGKIVIPIDQEERYSFFPKYCVGIRDGYQKNITKEVGFFLIKNHGEDESEYKMQMAMEIGKRDKRYNEIAIEEDWFIGNKMALTDRGELVESIYSHQVEEMKRDNIAEYIRDGRNTFYLKTDGNIELYENVGYRFLLLPQNFNEVNFRGLYSYSIEELENIIKKKPNDCTLDLHIAMRQLDKDRIKKFIKEIVKEQKIFHEEETR